MPPTRKRTAKPPRRAPLQAPPPLSGFDPKWRERIEALDVSAFLPLVLKGQDLEREIREALLAYPAGITTYDKTLTPEKLHAELRALQTPIERAHARSAGAGTSEVLRIVLELVDLEIYRLEAEFRGSGRRTSNAALKFTAMSIFLKVFVRSPYMTSFKDHFRLVFSIFDAVGLDHPAIENQSTDRLGEFFMIDWSDHP